MCAVSSSQLSIHVLNPLVLISLCAALYYILLIRLSGMHSHAQPLIFVVAVHKNCCLKRIYTCRHLWTWQGKLIATYYLIIRRIDAEVVWHTMFGCFGSVQCTYLNVPLSTSCPERRTWVPSLRREPNAIASPIAQSASCLLAMSARPRKARFKPVLASSTNLKLRHYQGRH